MPTPEICPQCGAAVPARACACPECGSDEQTGWSERAQSQRLDLPDDEFSYDEFLKEEFGETGKSPADRLKPRRLHWIWWLVGVGLIVAFLWSVFGGLL